MVLGGCIRDGNLAGGRLGLVIGIIKTVGRRGGWRGGGGWYSLC